MNNWTIQIVVTTICLVSSKSSYSERIVTMLSAVATKASAPCLPAPCPALPPKEEVKVKAVEVKARARAEAKAEEKAKARAKVKAKENVGRAKAKAASQQRRLSRLTSKRFLASFLPKVIAGIRMAKTANSATLMPSNPTDLKSLSLKLEPSQFQQRPLRRVSVRGKRTSYVSNSWLVLVLKTTNLVIIAMPRS